jgi:hypothetical protein
MLHIVAKCNVFPIQYFEGILLMVFPHISRPQWCAVNLQETELWPHHVDLYSTWRKNNHNNSTQISSKACERSSLSYYMHAIPRFWLKNLLGRLTHHIDTNRYILSQLFSGHLFVKQATPGLMCSSLSSHHFVLSDSIFGELILAYMQWNLSKIWTYKRTIYKPCIESKICIRAGSSCS